MRKKRHRTDAVRRRARLPWQRESRSPFRRHHADRPESYVSRGDPGTPSPTKCSAPRSAFMYFPFDRSFIRVGIVCRYRRRFHRHRSRYLCRRRRRGIASSGRGTKSRNARNASSCYRSHLSPSFHRLLLRNFVISTTIARSFAYSAVCASAVRACVCASSPSKEREGGREKERKSNNSRDGSIARCIVPRRTTTMKKTVKRRRRRSISSWRGVARAF